MTCKLININFSVAANHRRYCNHVHDHARQGVAAALIAVRKLSDFEVEILMQLWHDEPCLWYVSLRSYSNQDARKAAIMRISD